MSATNITGPNAGWPRQFPIPTPLAARVGQLGRMKNTIAFFVLVMASLTACRHTEAQRALRPEVTRKRSSELQMCRQIVGEWTNSDLSHGMPFQKLVIAQDHTLVGVWTDGTRDLLGTWACQGQVLRVARSRDIIEAARANGADSSEFRYYHVFHVDAHELIMATEFMRDERFRFTK